MRRNSHVITAMNFRQKIDFIGLFSKKMIGVSLFALSLANPALAQVAGESVYVDISDPNITIDFSVLDDNSRGSQLRVHKSNAPVDQVQNNPSAATNSLRQPTNEGLPVSTLYIQPSKEFSLPPQTKALIVDSVPAQTVAEDAPMVTDTPADATPEVTADVQPREPVAVEPVAPPPPAAVVQAPIVETKPEPKVVVVEPPVQEPPVAPVVVAAPTPVPAPAAVPTPAPAPVKAAPEVKVEAAPVAPPPPPMALTQPPAPQEKAPVADLAPETAPPPPAAPSGTVVVDLPPEDAPQPGVASLPPSTGPLSDGDNMRIVFDQDSSKLPQDARDALKALSDQLKGQENLRLQLLAYAGTADTSASAARRLSLSRALAVRSHLIESGVRSTRIDVRALGNKSSDEVTERVDITVVER
jgi:outer membrane protein OmpA-like peptidoglycan-associated protein